MFKPTPSLSITMRRLRLTVKKGPKKGYYKGNRTGSIGTHTKFGNYRIDLDKVRTYVVPPDLKTCPVSLPVVWTGSIAWLM
jgi:large subunit ribosomal protein L41